MSEKTEYKLQSSLYMIKQLEDRVESIEEDVDGAKDQVDSLQGDVDNVHDHMLEIEVQQEDRRNHLIVQQEKTDDLTARVKSLEAHLVWSEEKDRQQTELILRLQKRVGALEGNREQSGERKCCDYKGCDAPVYYDVSRGHYKECCGITHARLILADPTLSTKAQAGDEERERETLIVKGTNQLRVDQGQSVSQN
jgi:hypothetical protein